MIRFIPRQMPNQIFVIGCGGTGSRLVPLLAQFIKTVTHGVSPRGTVIDPTIFLIDDDVVEHKNLARQNFIESDVGKPKAAVLAGRYSRAFGVNIIPIITRITSSSNITSMTDAPMANVGSNSMLIMCVDSAQARRDILTSWSNLGRHTSDPAQAAFVIDAGNEDDFGQVRFFNLAVSYDKEAVTRSVSNIPALTPETCDIHCMPMDTQFYLNLRDNPGGSCADLDQTLAINALMATMIMGVVQNFYYLKPFPYHSMGVSLKSGGTTLMITPSYLQQVSISRALSRPPLVTRAAVAQLEGTIQEYAANNVRKLREMGLKPDGSLMNPPTGKVVVEKTTPAAKVEETLVEAAAAEEVSEVPQQAPEVVAPARPARRRARTATPATTPVLPAGLETPPPLRPVRP